MQDDKKRPLAGPFFCWEPTAFCAPALRAPVRSGAGRPNRFSPAERTDFGHFCLYLKFLSPATITRPIACSGRKGDCQIGPESARNPPARRKATHPKNRSGNPAMTNPFLQLQGLPAGFRWRMRGANLSTRLFLKAAGRNLLKPAQRISGFCLLPTHWRVRAKSKDRRP